MPRLACANEEREIADFPEFDSKLSGGQLIRLRAIAAEIIRSKIVRNRTVANTKEAF